MNSRVVQIALAGCIAFFAWRGGHLDRVASLFQKPEPAPVVAPAAAPSAEMQSFVAPVKTLAGSLVAADPTKAADAIQVGRFYADFAAVVAAQPADNPALRSTGSFRAAHIAAQESFAKFTTAAGKLPGLSKAIDEAIAAALGKEDAAITPEKRQRLVDVLNAIAWACGV